MCAAYLNIYDIVALCIIGLGAVLLLVEVCAFLFKRYEKNIAHPRAQHG